MREYTNKSPEFSDTILIIEEGKDYNHADTVNVATKQLLDNELVQKNIIDGLVHNVSELEKSGFTFVIDSGEKVIDWLHRKEGNDYSRVLVKRKEDESSYDVKIDMENREFNWFPLAADYVEFEEGVQLHFSHPEGANRQNKVGAILRCKSSRNVAIASYVPADYIFSGGSHIKAAVMGGYCGGFDGCDGLYECVVEQCDTSWVDTYPFSGCKRLYYCEVKGCALNENAFQKCTDLIGCHVDGNNVTIESFYRPFYECNNLYNCTAASISFREGESNTFYTQLFSGCRGLYSCTPVPVKDRVFNGYVRSNCTADHDLWDEASGCFWQIKVNGGQLQLEKVYDDE